jgi:catechol 2,3-dioxygenase-like lactoylglutathione lyase family enzyme
MAIRDITVVALPVSDQERAKAFYVEQLGFELRREDDAAPGLRWVQVAPPGATTALALVTWFESMPPGSLRGLGLRSDDLQADYEALVAQGVAFDEPPQRRPGGTEAVLRDPDGNRLVLQQA